MDAIEFNKTLSEEHTISSKGAPEKMLTECRNMGFSILLLNYFTVV
jgi:predicted ABC-type ATPase